MSEGRLFDSNVITEKYMDSILIEERIIDSVLPDLEIEFLGDTFATPIMMPAFSHLMGYAGRPLTGLEEYSIAAKNCNMLNFAGMMENDLFEKIINTGAKTARIIKPYADREKVKDQIRFAEEKGAFAVGMDIDHIMSSGEYDLCVGERMAPQTSEGMAELVQMTKLPFIVKGVLSVQDAVKSAQIGAKAIIVSHHHGRMNCAVPPMMVLPKIKEALKGTGVKIIVDCCIASGSDIYKALALGADAVAIGRVMMPDLEKEGTPGVEKLVKKLNGDLAYFMGNTGFSKVSDMDSSALWIPKMY